MCDTVVNNLFIVFWRFDFLYFLALFPFDFFITLSTLGGSVVGGGSRKRDHRDFDSGPAACPLDPVPKSQDLWCESSTNIQRIFTLDFLILGLALPPPPFPRTAVKILQKTAFSLVKSWLALRSLDCLFVCLSPCGKWPHTQENGCYCPPLITSIWETLLQTRQDQERGPASLLHSWHWVLFIWESDIHVTGRGPDWTQGFLEMYRTKHVFTRLEADLLDQTWTMGIYIVNSKCILADFPAVSF